jgi:hypothetical protein
LVIVTCLVGSIVYSIYHKKKDVPADVDDHSLDSAPNA